MVLSRTYRIFAIFMALLLMVNTSGLTMDMHFCQGDLKRVNFIGKAKSCAEVLACLKKCGKELPACHKSTNSEKSSNGHDDCCDNDQVLLDMDYDAGAAYGIEFNQTNFKTYIPRVKAKISASKEPNILAYLPIPPLIAQDFFAELQTYLL